MKHLGASRIGLVRRVARKARGTCPACLKAIGPADETERYRGKLHHKGCVVYRRNTV